MFSFCCSKDTVAYREALKRIKSREHQTTGNTVCVNEKTTLDIAPEQMDDCAPKVQPKPNRRPSQTQLLKPKVCKTFKCIENSIFQTTV